MYVQCTYMCTIVEKAQQIIYYLWLTYVDFVLVSATDDVLTGDGQ